MGEGVFVLGKIAFAAIGVAVGWQLAVEARRGDAVGLHTLALAAIGIGGLGLLAMPLANALGSEPLSLAGEVAVRIALLLLCFFVARTFRPGALGLALAVVFSASLIATLVWDVRAQPSLIHYDYALVSSHANQAVAALPFAWSVLESAAAWRRTRRRVRVGLADPVLAERFLLWSLVTSCFVGINGLAIAGGVASASGATGVAEAAHGLRGVLYLAITAFVWRARFATTTADARDPTGDGAALD